ncbi:hypothetical protein [Kitasatospora purpeofusca]|uniref:hypothetical protein n=1 Tax=Kitasatospora purpeofusca TaxID=67352 RepID=UPI003F4AB287
MTLPRLGDNAQGQALVETPQRDAGLKFVGEAGAAHGTAAAVDGQGVDGEDPAAVARVGGEARAGGAELAVVVAAAAVPVDAPSVELWGG